MIPPRPRSCTDALIWRALSLDERLVVVAAGDVRAGASIGDNGSRWRGLYGTGAMFERRLAWDGIASAAARAAWAAPPVTLRAAPGAACTLDAVAPWARTLDEVIDAMAEPPPADAPACTGVPFVHVWQRVLPYARRQIDAAIDDAGRAVRTPAVTTALEGLLLERLGLTAAQVLYQEFSARRPPGSRLDALAGAAGDVYYRRFIDALGAGGFASLCERFPVLGRMVAVTMDHWVRAGAALVQRIAADQTALAEAFHAGAPVGAVVAVDAPLSDAHAGHQVVCRVAFAHGVAVAYKPRTVGMEARLGRVSAWLAARGVETCRMPRVLERDGYGWMEWVEAQPCPAGEPRVRYFERIGALMAMLHLLRGTDAHVDNLVTHGEWPVLVDAETLCQPEARQEVTASDAPPSLTLAATVLRTGLLPGWHDAGLGPDRDVSALGATGTAGRSRGAAWTAVNTDAMAPAAPVPPAPMTPADASRLRPQDHLEAIDRGFTAAYDAMVKGRDELCGPGGVIEHLADERSRFVFRPTHVYDQLRRVSLSPALMTDGAARSLLFERMRVPFARLTSRPPQWDIVTAEIAQLFDLDIPSFTAPGHARVVDGGVARPVAVLGRAPIEEVHAAFDGAGAEDLALQRMLIQGSILAHAARVDAPPVRRAAGAPVASGPEPLVEAACVIAARLAERARRDARLGAYWLGPRFTPSTGRFAFHASGESLFEGAMGTALFLAACDACTGERRFGALADEALHSVRRYVRLAGDAESEWFARRLGIGGAFGLGSLVYGFTVLAALTGRRDEVEHACDAARLITQARIDGDRQIDVTGGAAGALLALLALHRVTGEAWALEIAHACGRHLIRHAQPQPDGGLGWITTADVPVAGFAHGSAGIALALSRLAGATGDSDMAAAARAGFAFDTAWLAAQTTRRTDRWCSGTAGDALARIGTSDPETRPATEAALDATGRAPGGDLDTLCCGLAGRVETLLVAAGTCDRPDLRAAALDGARDLAGRARTPGALRCLPPLDAALVTPGLFQGMAGIGWTLLRASGVVPLPALLLWEPPPHPSPTRDRMTGVPPPGA